MKKLALIVGAGILLTACPKEEIGHCTAMNANDEAMFSTEDTATCQAQIDSASGEWCNCE